MKRKHFFAKIDDKQIASAVARAQESTSGQIRVFVSHHASGNVLSDAQKHFKRLGLGKTHHRNSIFIIVAPESQTFALLGDTAIHEKCGDSFWQALRDEMIPAFKAENYMDGILHAIQRAGGLLSKTFELQMKPETRWRS
jgi:uncharacterized membrane protein